MAEKCAAENKDEQCMIDKIAAESKDITEMKLYCPLRFTVILCGFYDGCFEADPVDYIYRDDEINEQIRSCFKCDQDTAMRGFALYFHDEKLVQKVYSAVPEVETRNGDIYGVITVKSLGNLNEVELNSLIQELTEQLSHDDGAGFEPCVTQCLEAKTFVAFWRDNDYFLKPESEIFPEQELNQEMGGIN